MAKGSKGIVRLIDDLGRVVIPKEMRWTAGVGEGEPVDIFFKDGVICVEPYISEKCVCCGATDRELLEVNEVQMCENCIWKFRDEMAKNDEKTQEYIKALGISIARRERTGGC